MFTKGLKVVEKYDEFMDRDVLTVKTPNDDIPYRLLTRRDLELIGAEFERLEDMIVNLAMDKVEAKKGGPRISPRTGKPVRAYKKKG